MAENDWSTYTLPFHTGRRAVQVFLLVPVVSRRKCFSRHISQDVHALMDGHVKAFERLGGVPRRIKYDNQKAVVIRREGGQPIFNPRFVDFATYYEFTPELARPMHPNDKPRVERGFWELERSFHNGRSLHDEADYDAQLLRWMNEVADLRIVRGDGRMIAECFAAEAPHLLPRTPRLRRRWHAPARCEERATARARVPRSGQRVQGSGARWPNTGSTVHANGPSRRSLDREADTHVRRCLADGKAHAFEFALCASVPREIRVVGRRSARVEPGDDAEPAHDVEVGR